jgi:phospholipid transport system substrate-binding protein
MSGIPSRWLACLLAACFVLAAGALRPAPALAADPQAGAKAEAFVESLADAAIAALTTAGASREQRENRARELLARYFAVDTIGRWVLGRYWQQATPAQQTDYLALFEDLIVTTYVDRFSRYSGERLTVSRSLVDEASGDVLVYSQITRPAGGQPVEVGWRVRARDGTMKVVDVYVEGVSLGQTQRSEFASVIRNTGGKVAGLLDEMRRRVKRQA